MCPGIAGRSKPGEPALFLCGLPVYTGWTQTDGAREFLA